MAETNNANPNQNDSFFRALSKTMKQNKFTPLFARATAEANSEHDPWDGGYTFFIL
ncbi:hypothetical protein N9M06_03900 [Candidatus Poseidoniales archaeon]|nr:hypothetical protein [Candidatus Poseidoniales archaeon]MDC0285520.1 hypothetical protein [Candidatus Poseidoniaceae archaeon]MDA8716271.1 hypothetical protein [Candidatus Poseidoniales archaeon]MDA8718307.1 hypothetical protein [Candidatus Poseidoniales archaeon]MDB2333702.1 hypothetical protein [Candidatus Poseidoniales archaeon]|tara:strand:+ start:6780 stop:6947 length:168 start_codon:yes stop_codon:yes gene_type:complete